MLSFAIVEPARKPPARGRIARRPLVLAWLAALVLAAPAAAERIDAIRIERAPVFPETTGVRLPWLLRTANRLHPETRESVIRREILFHEGSPFDSLRIRESERLLRERGFFESARITCDRTTNGTVATIRTQDLWTFGIVTSYEKQANLSSLTLGLRDTNLMGTGNYVHWYQTFSTDQDVTYVETDLPRLGATRAAASFSYTDQKDAHSRLASVGRFIETPFDRWTWDAETLSQWGNQRFFEEGEETGVSPYKIRRYGIQAGRFGGGGVQAGYGLGWVDQQLAPKGVPVTRIPGLPPPTAVERIRVGGPLAYVGLIRRRYVTAMNLERYGTTEDVPLGWAAHVSVVGNVRHRDDPAHALAVRSNLDAAALLGGATEVAAEVASLLFARAGRTLGERAALATATVRWQPSPRALTIAQAGMLAGADRPGAAVFYIGSDTALRGFPARAFEARNYFLGTLEQRVWSDVEVLWVGLGGNLFVDTARPSPDDRLDHGPWRTGWGGGLLLGLRKSSQKPLRLEVAWRTDRSARPTFSITSTSWLRLIPPIHLPGTTGDLREGFR